MRCDGILIPGGFGARGIEGKVITIQYAREHQIPFLGLCLGMQCATIEFARNVAGLKDANSAEFDEQPPHPVIHLMSDQQSISDKGGTMRLGSYTCKLGEGTLAQKMYGLSDVRERHRHRYEFNNAYRDRLTAKGLGVEWTVTRWTAGGNRRVAESSLVLGNAISSGVQLAAASSTPLVHGVCGSGVTPKVRPLK